MNKKIAALIMAWHETYVALGSCSESAAVVFDQHRRATLQPDRIQELRREIMEAQDKIPALGDLLEELSGGNAWPMKAEDESPVADPIVDEEAAAEAADFVKDVDVAPDAVANGDYDAEGNSPIGEPEVDEEAAAEIAHEARVHGEDPQPENDA